MLTGGHVAVSYLLAESAKSFGLPLTGTDVLWTIVAGNIIDTDFFLGFLTGKTGEAHHQNITHTPIGVLLIVLGIILLFHPSLTFSFLLFLALFIHLILDDIGYWFYKLNFLKSHVNPQVNWLFPITPFHKNKLMKSNKDVLKYYLFKTWPVSLTEAGLIVLAVGLFIIRAND